MRTLIINSYAGSLTIGAHTVGAEVIGSYEDSNFGLDIQKANFPRLNYVEFRKDWPAQDLSDTIVVAHPPCSAFSVQNCSPKARGVDSEAFACTKHVVDYAAKNGALAICIESVMGALGGAWNVHQAFADEYGYDLYRVLQNGCMFGCQWRERYWSVYVRKGATASNVLRLTIQPKWQTVGEIVTGHEDGPASGNQDVLLERQKTKLRDIAQLTDDEMNYLFDGSINHGTRALGSVLFDYKYRSATSTAKDKWDMFKKYIGGFASGTMCYLDENGLAPVLMGGSHWYLHGRNVSEDAFAAIGGFPDGYVFPEEPRNYRRQQRMYISKGVMPPVAAWIIEQVTGHLGESVLYPVTDESKPLYRVECEPNHIADFRISKEGWKNRETELPQLRGFDEQPPPPKAFVTPATPPTDDDTKETTVSEQDNVKQEPIESPEPQAPKTRRPRVRGQVQAVENVMVPDKTAQDKKRVVIYEFVKREGSIDHQALVECLADKLKIEAKTAHWHLQQMKKAGLLQDVEA